MHSSFNIWRLIIANGLILSEDCGTCSREYTCMIGESPRCSNCMLTSSAGQCPPGQYSSNAECVTCTGYQTRNWFTRGPRGWRGSTASIAVGLRPSFMVHKIRVGGKLPLLCWDVRTIPTSSHVITLGPIGTFEQFSGARLKCTQCPPKEENGVEIAQTTLLPGSTSTVRAVCYTAYIQSQFCKRSNPINIPPKDICCS